MQKKPEMLRQARHERNFRFPHARAGEPLPVAPQLRLDHGALAALLVPPPTPPVLAGIWAILKSHNPIEEGPGGIYDRCAEWTGAEADQILRQLQNYSDVKVVPHVENPFVMEARPTFRLQGDESNRKSALT